MTLSHRNNGPQMVARFKLDRVNMAGISVVPNAPQNRPVICDRPSRRNAEFEKRFARRHCEASPKPEAVPIWLAALYAARCSADDGSQRNAVSWNCVAGRAVYTNAGAHA